MPIQGLTSVQFELGNQFFIHEFLIANITDDCIIGLDLMQKFGFSIDIGGGALTCGDVEIALLNDEDEEENGRIRRIMLTEDTSLPAQSELIFYEKLEPGHTKTRTALIEGKEDNYSEFAVGKTLVMIDRDQKVPVRVMNLGLGEKKLRKDSIIAVCYTFDLIQNCSDDNIIRDSTASAHLHITGLLGKIKTNLSDEQYASAEKLICEFNDIFPTDETDCGRTNMVQHRIDRGNTRPIRHPPRRLPLAKQKKAMDMIECMRRQGVIEPSNSPWCSPIVLVRKKKKTVLCDSV
ncbi:uncharacterized protein LOC129925085 [Biomphalaria glabrata]|uniref:Uncharacterized protein LOC129925085 n=1 Tax=Biomphalaria glabrata TaxID=6526 RepID=A0A9W2ZWR1_BIOGL|nr:uncharacterized protein LOC129925085 [Biomphalaria glabrata]